MLQGGRRAAGARKRRGELRFGRWPSGRRASDGPIRGAADMPTRSSGKLEEYRARRNFDVTPEPAPGTVEPTPAGAPARFMVHKHDASRLHYDLRLEIDGALASWAIPKGPSYDPALKRFAVQTEDHPLEYGSFEGRIPEGEYGAGDSIIWDRGTFDTVPPGVASEMRRKGHLHIKLSGDKLKGEWHIVRTRADASGKAGWLFFKAKDGLENPSFDVVADRPESVISGRRITRGPVRKKDLRSTHPEPQKLLEKVWPPMLATLASPTSASPDKHVFEVKYDGYRGLAAASGGRVAFLTRNAIDLGARFPQIYRALARLSVPEVVVDGEVVAFDAQGRSRFELLTQHDVDHRFVTFDILWLDGEDLRGRPQEEAIIGFTPISTGAKEIGALLLGVHDGEVFRFAGKVGTGYTSKLRQQLRAMLQKDVIDKPAAVDAPRMRDAVWVKPHYVAQVRFTEWTHDGRLRHPSFLGIREDKAPEETRREEPVDVPPQKGAQQQKRSSDKRTRSAKDSA